MKKIFLCATIAVAMCFASCEGFDASDILNRLDNLENQLDGFKNNEENNQGEDNSSKNSEIIGSWRYVENAGDDSPIEVVWVFSADGRFYQTFPADSAFGGYETREGTYQYDGKTLTIRYNGEMWSEIYNVVISGDSMTVMPNNNEVPPLTFHRQ